MSFLSGLRNFFIGSPAQSQQFDLLSPAQQQQFQQLLNLFGQSIGQQDFSGIENKARTNFMQNTIPSIMERLTAMGGSKSSALAQQLAGAGTDLETNLAGLRSQYLQNQLSMLLGPALQQNTYTDIQKRNPGLLGGFGQALAPAAGIASGLALGSAIPGVSGSIGTGLSSLMSLFNRPRGV